MRDRVAFDRVVVVDWSANSSPKTGRDSIWIAECANGALTSTNIATRHEAIEHLAGLVQAPGRCLIGVDFSLGFPAGTAAALGLPGTPWQSMWELLDSMVEDQPSNANNRFDVAARLNRMITGGPGPFWGCPPSQASATLTTTKVPCVPLPEWRIVEARLRSAKYRPFSSWQLLGAGAVGSQSLLGIAALSKLLGVAGGRLQGRVDPQADRTIEIWPFTSGFVVPDADIVLVEVWPSLIALPGAADKVWRSKVRDQLQVELQCAHLVDPAFDLETAFTVGPDHEDRGVVVAEEGWILGETH